MRDLNRFLGFLYRLFFTVIINFTIINVSIDALGDNLSYMNLLLIVISTLISITIFFAIDKKPIILLSLLVVGIVSAVITNKYYNEIFRSFTDDLQDFIFWVTKYINRDIYLDIKYFNLFLILFSILLSLFIYVSVYKFKRVYPLLISGTAFFLYRWFWYQDSALNYYYIFILSILLLYIYNRYKYNTIEWQINDKDYTEYNIKSLFIYSTLVSCLIIFIAFILPKNNPPITWRWMDNKVQNSFPQVTEWRNSLKKSKGYGNSLKFNLSYTQYQKDEKRLGGDIQLNNFLVMEVESDRPLYLKGRVSDKYTGFFWKSEKDNITEYSKNEPIEVKDDNVDSYSEVTYEIKYNNLTTSTVFNSYIPVDINYTEKLYVSDEYEIYTNKVILNEEGYKVESIIPYFDTSKLDDKYDKKEKYGKYLELPNSVPSNTHELAFDITKNAKNDYEKMMMLQNYLRNNYEYTLTPGNNDYDEDFVNHFLFETKKGYCTYFASALAVMGRSVDVPTRYVEGFITGDEKENGIYKVYSQYAHAWVEAYISGYGWMVFEATPAYQTPDYQEKEKVDEETTDEDTDDNTGLNNNSLEQRMREDLFEDEITSNGDSSGVKDNNSKNTKSLLFYVGMSIILLILILFIYIIYKIIVNNINEKRIKSLSSTEKIKAYYLIVMRLLSLLEYEKSLGETDKEFIHRVDLSNKLNDSLNYFINIYIRTIYGKKELSLEDQIMGKKLIVELETEVKKEKGFLKFMLYKYIIKNGRINRRRI